MKIDEESLLSGDDQLMLRSSLLVAALQALQATGGELYVAETKDEKFLFIQKDDIIVCFHITPDADPYSEKIQLFARALANAVIKIHDERNIDTSMVEVQEYLSGVGSIIEKIISKLLDRIRF